MKVMLLICRRLEEMLMLIPGFLHNKDMSLNID